MRRGSGEAGRRECRTNILLNGQHLVSGSDKLGADRIHFEAGRNNSGMAGTTPYLVARTRPWPARPRLRTARYRTWPQQLGFGRRDLQVGRYDLATDRVDLEGDRFASAPARFASSSARLTS